MSLSWLLQNANTNCESFDIVDTKGSLESRRSRENYCKLVR